jgi:hypothetical protein
MKKRLTVNMGSKHLTSPYLVTDFQRQKDRNRKADAARTLLSISQDCEELFQEDSTTYQGTVCQTDLTYVGLTVMPSKISYLQ